MSQFKEILKCLEYDLIYVLNLETVFNAIKYLFYEKEDGITINRNNIIIFTIYKKYIEYFVTNFCRSHTLVVKSRYYSES